MIGICCIMMPLAAHAWTLNTWVKSAGGFMTSPNFAGNQTSVNGSVTKSYTTTSPLTVTVTPNPGYSISNLTKNGLIQTLADPTAVYSTTALGPPNQSVQATFARTAYALSASAGSGGTVSPASITPVYLGGQSPAKVFTFTPASGYSVQSIDVPGHLLNTDYQLFDATTNALVTLPAATNVRVKVSIVNVKSSTTLMGMFAIVGANAGPSQTVLAGTPVILDGSASTGATTYAWTQVSGPATVTLSGADSSQATFTAPAILGSYLFRLTINGGSSSTTTVFVSDSVAQAARNQCANCHATQGVGPGVYANWSSSVHKIKVVLCYTCHVGANTGGHPGSVPSGSVDGKTFNYIAGGANFCVTCHSATIVTDFAASPHVVPAGTASCSFCHANVHNVNAACVNCHTPGNSYGLPWPPPGLDFHDAYTGTNLCVNCHNLHNPAIVTGCDGCHDSPPATASHLKHYGSTVSGARYGDTRITQAFGNYSSGYMFGCGNCHPLDGTKHRNGVVDVELYNPLAEAGSIKALNPVSAAYVAGPEVFVDNRGLSYTKGTCSSVYCHSYNDWTTTTVIPENDPDWQSKVVVTRNYRTITWGSAPLTCSGCHGNPTQTSSPGNDGGAGDSHSWIDPYGYQNLHTWNMGYAPISCQYCHNDTVKQLNTYTEDSMGVRTLGDVPVNNFTKHVNGRNDVAFDKQNPFVYSTSGSGNIPMSLANATYDPVTKNCSNVSCHIQQTTVPWGKPYRWYNYDSECDSCHGYSN
jgi:predicted CxxxxCH...CXXCH cytochrome family protein